MTSKILECVVLARVLAGATASCSTSSIRVNEAGDSAADVLEKARVLDRLAEGQAVERKGSSPGFVIDPAWPQPLPNQWVIGDVGGIAVDRHDRIWKFLRYGATGCAGTGSAEVGKYVQ